MSNLPLVALALAALLVGPLLARVWSRGRAWRAVIDGLSLALVGGLCLLVLAPDALASAGPGALVAGVVGAMAPGWTHRLSARWERTFAYAGLALLCVHAAVDGAALALSGGSMGAAVIGHRLPMGLAVYSAASRSATDSRPGFLAVGLLMVATVVGFVAGAPLSDLGGPVAHGWFEAFVAGLLLHIVFEHAPVFPAPENSELLGHGHSHREHSHAGHDHREVSSTSAQSPAADPPAHHGHAHSHGHNHPSARAVARAGGSRWSAVGAFVGMAVVAALVGAENPHDHTHADHAGPAFLEVVVELALHSAPALLLGYLLAGLGSGLLRAPGPRFLRSTGPWSAALRGLGFGLPRPVCACGVVPQHEALYRRGAPVAAGLAFLVATPALGLDMLPVSVSLLGIPLTLARVVAACVVTLGVAMVFWRTPAQPDTLPGSEAPLPLLPRLRAGFAFGTGPLVDHTLPWIALSLVVAGLGVVALDAGQLDAVPALLQVPVVAVLGIPLFVCATGATPAVAVLAHHGLASGAALALLVAGPALNLPALAMVRSLLGRRAAWLLTGVVVGIATVAGWGVGAAELHVPTVGAHAPPGLGSWVALLVLGGLAARSVVRQGARGVVAQIVEPVET